MKACHILFNPFTIDARVQKELRTIEKIDYISEIELFCLHTPDLPKNEVFSQKVKVKRIPRPFIHSKIKLLKIFGFIIWNFLFIKEVIKSNPDVVHCHDLIALPIGFTYKILKSSALVYDAHEFETEVQSSKGLKRIVAKIAEKIMMVKVDHLISVSQSILDNYIYRYGEKPNSLIKNFPYRKEIVKKDLFRKNFNIPGDHLIILYQGIFVKGRGIEKVIDSFKQNTNKKIHLILMGKGDLEERIKEESRNSKNIHFQPFVNNSIVLEYTSSADLGLCLIENCCRSYYFCLPNKLFEYVAGGIPVVATNLYELEYFINETKTGLTVDYRTYDLNSILTDLTKIQIEEYKKNCENLSPQINWEHQEHLIREIYDNLLK